MAFLRQLAESIMSGAVLPDIPHPVSYTHLTLPTKLEV